MRTVLAMAGSLMLLAVAGFCLFGFMATFEPTDRSGTFFAFRVAYAVVGGVCLLVVVALLWRQVGNLTTGGD